MEKEMIIETNNSSEKFHVKVVKEKKEKVKISIILRVKNEEKKIDECLNKIFSQKCNEKYEVIIIDSGSTDNTLEIVKKYDVNIYCIPSEEFNFGTSMQLGINLANGEYCVFVSGHAIPTDNNWLHNMFSKFDDNTAAVYGKQTYYKDTYILEKESLDMTFGDSDRVQKWNNSYKKFNDYKNEIVFSNANSCIRKDIAMDEKFSKLIASEDREWALRILKKGYNIKYSSDSCVYHSHNETLKQYYKRIFINSKALYQFTGVHINLLLILPLYFVSILKDIKYMIRTKAFSLKNVLYSIKYRWMYSKAHYNATRKEII